MFVVDTSIAAAWLLPDERNAAADRLLARIRVRPAHAPALFWFEMRNTFLSAERRRRLSREDSDIAMAELRRLPIHDDGLGLDAMIFSLGRNHGLTAYDASYLALAIQKAVPLATDDRQLAAAGRSEGVEVLGTGVLP